ncbi:MAG: signal peptidase I [bacterium]|nr:signal peptidase I [bacterium]
MKISAKYLNCQKDMTTFGKIKYLCHFIARSFLCAVLVFFIIFFVFMVSYFGDLFYNLRQGNNKFPLFNAYVIVSPSMVPTIMVNDAIVVKREDGGMLNIGDIITFSSADASYPGLTVTHRIVSKQKAQNGNYIFRTKGDNNNIEDPTLVSEDSIYGKVILKIPKLGYIRKFLLTSYGFFFGIVIPAVAIIILDILKIFKRKKHKCSDDELEII